MRVPRKQDEKFSLNVGKADCVVNVASEIRHRCHDYDTESYLTVHACGKLRHFKEINKRTDLPEFHCPG